MVKRIVGMVLMAIVVTVVVAGTVTVSGGGDWIDVPEVNVELNANLQCNLLAGSLGANFTFVDNGLKGQCLDNLLALGDWHGDRSGQIELKRQSQLEFIGDMTVL